MKTVDCPNSKKKTRPGVERVFMKPYHKPNSVVDNYLSRMCVAAHLKRFSLLAQSTTLH
jgi:hypothetical protein